MGEKAAKATEFVGYVTGDREVEAEGRVRRKVAEPADPEQDVTAEEVAAEELAVRTEHGDRRAGPDRA